MPSPYRAVLFDLDGTLIDERHGVRQARDATAAALGALGYPIGFEAFHGAIQSTIDEALAASRSGWPASFTRDRIFEGALRRLDLDTALAPQLAETYKRARLADLALLPGARELLEALQRSTPLGLITNGEGGEQREKLRRCDLNRYFDVVAISGELGVAKPDPAIFRRTLDLLGVAAAEAVFVGNNYATDVAGACAAELDAVWLNPNGDPPPNPEAAATVQTVRSVAEIADRLGLRGA